MTISGGELLLELLESQGIDQIFCSPGTEWAPVWEALVKRSQANNHKLKYTNCRHEILAVSMAQGYAETSGRMAAVLLHSAAGVLSGSLAIRNALFAKTPMLIISGETYEHRTDPGIRPQGYNWLRLLSDIGGPASMVESYVKWSAAVKNRDNLIDLIERGCRIAQAPNPGPVFLTVAPELLATQVDQLKVQPALQSPIKYAFAPGDLTQAVTMLSSAHSPVILTEYAGKYPAAVSELVKLAESLSAPVFEFYPFFGNFPKEHPLYIGYDAASVLEEADLVLIVGSTMPWYPPSACLRENVKVILLDEDSLHLNMPHWGYHIDLALTADITESLEAINALIGLNPIDVAVLQSRLTIWRSRHEKMLEDWKKETLAGKVKQPLSVHWFLQKLKSILPADAIYVDETLTHTRTVHRHLGNPGCYVRPTYGGLGVGIGEAIGLKIAEPQRPLVLIIGDGSFNYNPVLAGLGLCQEYNLSIMIVILNNGGYMAMKTGHDRLYPQGAAASSGDYLGVKIAPAPDYVKIAQAFDAQAEQIKRPQEIEAALTRSAQGLLAGRTVLLDVISV